MFNAFALNFFRINTTTDIIVFNTISFPNC